MNLARVTSLLLFVPLAAITGAAPAARGLKVGPDHRHLVDRQAGDPVFLLADTAWNLNALTPAETDLYLDSRARLGFNTIMFALNFHPQADEKNSDGESAYIGPDKTGLNPAYFKRCDEIIAKCAARGLYAMPYAMWAGEKSGTMNGYTPAQLETIGLSLGKHFRGVANVILCAGGESTPHFVDVERVNAIGRGLKNGCDGENLVTVHSVSGKSSSMFFADAPWIDFHLSQGKSGSGPESVAYDAAALVKNDLKITPAKPAMMAEHRYESGVSEDPLIQRRTLYQCVFAGACGHGYGHNALWQMTPHTAKPWMLRGWKPGVADWKEALDTPAVRQFPHFRTFLREHPLQACFPDPSLVLDGQGGDVSSRVHAMRDGDPAGKTATRVMAYLSSSRSVTLDTRAIAAPKLTVRWFSPATGESRTLHDGLANTGRFALAKSPDDADGVLLIDAIQPQ